MKLVKIDTHAIQTNAALKKAGRVDELLPAIVVGTVHPNGSTTIEKGFQVEICGPCRIIQSDQQVGFDNARVWIETESDILVL